jgi:uncharacterized protein YigE (DUF2233 family)
MAIWDRRFRFIYLLPGLLLAACAGTADPAPNITPAPPPPTRAIPTLFPTQAVAVPRATPQPPGATQASDTGWIAGDHGVALRRLRLPGEAGRPAFPLSIARLDPAQVRLRVAYTPEQPRALRAWFDEAQPLVAINGGFFKDDYHGTALVISDGQASGPSYEGFGGMLTIAAGGDVSLRALSDQPYDPAEPLAQAMQSFPMLIFPGGAPAEIEDNGERARRSAVAMDRAGNLLLIASPTSEFTLHGLAAWLSQSDLEVDRALNLDGGSSTGLFVGAGEAREQIDSFGPLPLVLLVEAK